MPTRSPKSLLGVTPFTPTPFVFGDSKYAGMRSSGLASLKQLEAENAQMQDIIARQTVKIDAMEELMRKARPQLRIFGLELLQAHEVARFKAVVIVAPKPDRIRMNADLACQFGQRVPPTQRIIETICAS